MAHGEAMKILQSVNFSWKTRPSIIGLLATLAIAALFLAGCAVRLIGDYDDKIDTGVTEVHEKAELYFAKLRSDPMMPYDQSFYDDISARLAVLKTRAASLQKYEIITEQIGNLKTQFDTFQKLDRASKRPFPSVVVTDAESAISVSVESILKLELALKRGAKSPPALTNGKQ